MVSYSVLRELYIYRLKAQTLPWGNFNSSELPSRPIKVVRQETLGCSSLSTILYRAEKNKNSANKTKTEFRHHGISHLHTNKTMLNTQRIVSLNYLAKVPTKEPSLVYISCWLSGLCSCLSSMQPRFDPWDQHVRQLVIFRLVRQVFFGYACFSPQ